MITLNADRAETKSLHTNSSSLFVLTRCRPDICRQLLANLSTGAGIHWINIVYRAVVKALYVAAILLYFQIKIILGTQWFSKPKLNIRMDKMYPTTAAQRHIFWSGGPFINSIICKCPLWVLQNKPTLVCDNAMINMWFWRKNTLLAFKKRQPRPKVYLDSYTYP